MLTWFNNLKLQNKLIGTFLVIVMIGAISLGSSIYSLRQINAETQEVANVGTKLVDLNKAEASLIEQELNEKHLLLSGDTGLIEKHHEAQQQADELLQDALNLEEHEATREAIQALQTERETYKAIFAKIATLYNDGKSEEAIRVSEEESEPHIESLRQKVKALVAEGQDDVEEATSRADQQVQTATTIGIVSLLISIGLGLGIGIFVAHSISSPLATIVQGAKLLSIGDTKLTGLNQTEIDIITARRDEMGNIGRAFVALITYLQAMAEAAGQLAQGNVSTQITPQSDKDVLSNAFTQMIAYQRHMAEAAGQLAQGNVSTQITPQSDKDVLSKAFSQMITYQQQMAEAAGQLAQGNTSVQIIPQSDKDVLSKAFSQMITYQQQMAEAAGQLAQGNASVQIIPQSDKDVLSKAFSQMITYQQQMAEVASRMAQGDLIVNITPQSDQDALGNAFSQMITYLRNLVGQIIDTATTLNGASGQLATAADQASQASQQVAATIQQVATGTTQQTQAVTDATGNVEQMARAANGIAKGAQEQAQSVQKTSALVADMFQIVEQVGQVAHAVGQANTKVSLAARHSVASIVQTTQGMDAIRTRSLATADKVKEMGHRSKEISRIVETIDDIADKTDMLALNAAVEAARAGEHGRGFAVVAEQVRKLSEDSKGATRDIANLIERVQDSVLGAITAVELTVTEVGNGVQLAGDTAKSLQEILQATDEAALMAEQIGGATSQLRQKSEGVVLAIEAVSTVVEENTASAEEMAAGAQEVMQAMEGVASVAEENSASAEEVSASSEEMSAQVEEVLASAQELSLLAEQLRSAIAEFRIEEERPTQPGRPDRSVSALYPISGPSHSKTGPLPVTAGNGQSKK